MQTDTTLLEIYVKYPFDVVFVNSSSIVGPDHEVGGPPFENSGKPPELPERN